MISVLHTGICRRYQNKIQVFHQVHVQSMFLQQSCNENTWKVYVTIIKFCKAYRRSSHNKFCSLCAIREKKKKMWSHVNMALNMLFNLSEVKLFNKKKVFKLNLISIQETNHYVCYWKCKNWRKKINFWSLNNEFFF